MSKVAIVPPSEVAGAYVMGRSSKVLLMLLLTLAGAYAMGTKNRVRFLTRLSRTLPTVEGWLQDPIVQFLAQFRRTHPTD